MKRNSNNFLKSNESIKTKPPNKKIVTFKGGQTHKTEMTKTAVDISVCTYTHEHTTHTHV